MSATVRSLFVVMLLPLVPAAPAAAQGAPAAAQATTPDGSWALLRELPLQTRVSMSNPANDAVEATVATVYPDRVVLTSPRFEGGRFGRTEPNAVVVRQNDVARVAVLKLPRQHTVSPDRSDPRIAWRFAAGQPIGTKLRVRTTDGSRVEGRIVTIDERTVTLTVDKQPTPVAFTDVREVERRGWWTTGRKVGLAAGIAVGVLMGLATGLER